LSLEIEHLTSSLTENSQSIKELSLGIDKLESQLETFKKTLEIKEKSSISDENNIKELRNGLLSQKRDKLNLANKMRENLEKITELSFELDENSRILKTLKESLDRKFKDSFFTHYLKLKSLIKERNITGFYGLLIDLIAFDPKLRVGIENLAKSKLFSLIVEDFSTAEELIALNKEIKGGILTIYPLSWVKELNEKARTYPKSQDVIILKQRLSVNQNFSDKKTEILMLIEHIFGKGLFVKSYDLALKFAKEFNLNCVTAKGEVVYAEGYLTKLGFINESSEKLAFYANFSEKEREYNEKTRELEVEREKTRDLHNDEIKILRETQDLMIKETQIIRNVREIKGEIEEIKRNMKVLEENIENSQKIIGNLENEADQIKKKIDFFDNEKKIKGIGDGSSSDFMQKNEDLLKLQTRYNDLKESLIVTEEKLREVRKSKEETQREINEISEESLDKTSRNMEQSSLEDVMRELERSLQKIEKKEEENNENEKQMEDKKREFNEELEKLLSKMEELEKGIQEKKQLKNNLLVQKDDYIQKKVRLFL